ncbi:hypothetical protein Q0Z83_008190 [Actinoplanes sichuanensis]|nr:hypothetical protein Q0Z83_008190 [Actinoplanes sichuanensis]
MTIASGTLEEPAERISWFGANDDEPSEYMAAAGDVFQWLTEAHDMKRSLVGFFH